MISYDPSYDIFSQYVLHIVFRHVIFIDTLDLYNVHLSNLRPYTHRQEQIRDIVWVTRSACRYLALFYSRFAQNRNFKW